MIRIITTLFLLLIYIQGNGQIKEVDVFKSINTEQNFNLSEITNQLTYIRLSDGDQNALIGKITYITANKFFIVIYDRSVKKLFLFDSYGNFIRTLLNWGKGPNEFNDITSIDINSKNEILVLVNWDQLFIINPNGAVSGKISVKGNAPIAKWITEEIMAVIYYFPFYIRNDGYEISFINRKGEILSRALPNSLKNIDFNDFMPRFSCGWNRDTLYYWNEFRDTVFSLTKNIKVIPRMALRNSSQRYSVEEIKKGAKMKDSFNTNHFYILSNYNEVGNFALISGVFKQHRVCMVVDRETGIGHNIFEDYGDDHYIGLKNDVDGGFDFWPYYSSRSGDLLMPVDPNELRESFAKHYSAKRPIKSSARQDSVRVNIISKIKMMDNPIIIKIEK